MGRRYAGFCEGANSPTAIYLGAALPQPSSGLPGSSASSLNASCLTLLRARFTEPTASPQPLVVSYTTVSPLPRAGARGGLFSVALSRGLPRVGVTHRPALWSPDVPRHRPGHEARCGDATVCRPIHSGKHTARAGRASRPAHSKKVVFIVERQAAPRMPALLRRVAGTISVERSSSGMNSSKFFETPPPTMKRSGEKSFCSWS